jgi:hypothetical protein
MVLSWPEIHVRAQSCGAVAVLLLVLLLGPPEELVQYYRAFRERRLASSPTPSSWALPMIPTAAVLFMVVLLIGFLVGNKRRKMHRGTSKDLAPRWSKVNELYNDDQSFTLNLPCWKLSVDDGDNLTRFVPYWWDEGGVRINPKYTTIEKFIEECCTTTLRKVKKK